VESNKGVKRFGNVECEMMNDEFSESEQAATGCALQIGESCSFNVSHSTLDI
jgi:hypothetical protein